MDYFTTAIKDNVIPETWKIWKKHIPLDDTSYHGATLDSKRIFSEPVKDVIDWNRPLALTGCMPDSFIDLLGILGHPIAKRRKVKNEISALLREHTKALLKLYWKLTKTADQRVMTELDENTTVSDSRRPQEGAGTSLTPDLDGRLG